ncbi:MAG: TetR/AcrR family transcriptional regulator [Bacteroidota bacterium]
MPKTKISKEEILNKCWYVLHRNGYYHTSLNTLAKEVGLGKAGLLHHFTSKEGLMKAVLNHAAETYESYVLSVVKEELPIEQRLEKMLRRENRLAKIEGRGCFFGNTVVETSQQRVFNEQLQQFFEQWKKALENLFQEVMSEEKAVELAYLILVEYQGSVVLYKFSQDEDHLEQFVKRSLERLERLRTK